MPALGDTSTAHGRPPQRQAEPSPSAPDSTRPASLWTLRSASFIERASTFRSPRGPLRRTEFSLELTNRSTRSSSMPLFLARMFAMERCDYAFPNPRTMPVAGCSQSSGRAGIHWGDLIRSSWRPCSQTAPSGDLWRSARLATTSTISEATMGFVTCRSKPAARAFAASAGVA
jgi:hypothetical protein